MRALHARAESLEIATVFPQTTEQPREATSTPQPTPNTVSQSGGVNVEAEKVSAGEDIVGRDKVVSAGGHIIHAEAGSTVIIHERLKESNASESTDGQAGWATQSAREDSSNNSASMARLKRRSSQDWIRRGLIALLVVVASIVILSRVISGNNATSASTTQTLVAIAALFSNTPTPTVRPTSTSESTLTGIPIIIPSATRTPTLVTKASSPTLTPTSTATHNSTPIATNTRTISTKSNMPSNLPKVKFEIIAPGNLAEERVVLTNLGDPINIDGWRFSVGQHTNYRFPQTYLAQNDIAIFITRPFIDGDAMHYGKGLFGSPTKFLGSMVQSAPVWASGDISYLRDSSGRLIATYHVP